MARRRIHPLTTDNGRNQSEPLHTPLDRARIVGIMLELLQAEGLDGISMRKIADSLGVKASSLYYHVKDKEQLLHLLAEEISTKIDLPDTTLDWKMQLRLWSISFRLSLLQYPDAVHIMNATFAASPNRLAHIEFLFRALVEAGFKDVEVPWLASMLKNFIYGFVDEECRLRDRAKLSEEKREESEIRYKEIEALPKERYPHFIRLAGYTTSVNWEEEFSFGLDILLAGFVDKLARGLHE
ncbi:TetR/AcrR family transcriptional regulator C-terminal domain-containing protein [Paenibacillus sp. Root444D2]|uniref:TetR/AcrR family transcriptional regulator C-terminal domain-containing protein n=1 Tax=Paenibacillus sp. Root444D2 TaxID=1736538 RepID=UPI0007097816|nr:TetR/AcrR family transcriptional regulator C-terminal domain-containing protein [Paenibacillus sp. Root444D2]KQX68224.1 TetR family transcriptional regulator [Paenibacillus sp. Root444D2]